MLKKKYIRFNTSLYVILILIIKKSNKGFRLYVDYRAFNTFIVFNRNAPSLIKKTLIKFCVIRIYSKFDIIIAFNKIRIKKDHKKRIVFFIRYNFYEYIIMSFDLYNVFITF